MQGSRDKYILAIDQGTTGSRCFILDIKGRVVASAYREFRQFFPKPGWVEHDADEIWISVDKVIREALKRSRIKASAVAAIGITNQRETVVLWDKKTQKPVHRAIVWQDRRTADQCVSIKKHEASVRRITGLVLDPYFSATKIAWLLKHRPALKDLARQERLAFGTIDSWLISKLSNGAAHVTDRTNASRTLLYDIVRKRWSPQMLRLFGVPENILPEVLPSGAVFARTASVAGLPAGIPILAVMGDQQAALYGQGCFQAGSVKNTYGTGCFMVLNTGKRLRYSTKGLLTTLACDSKGNSVYALEGSVFIAGAAVQWLRDQLGLIPSSSATERAIASIKDNAGVYFVPAFVGLGAPYWDLDARGVITGLTRGSNKAHIVRAALEAMAYQTKDVFDVMQAESGLRIQRLAVDGGACANDFLMQFQADVLNRTIVRPTTIDSTVLGVAYLAGVQAGIWNQKDLARLHRTQRVFKPRMPKAQAADLYAGWQRALRQARTK